MAAAKSIAKLLERHKSVLAQELGEKSTLLSRLGDKAVLSILEQRAILGEERQEIRGDILVEIISGKGFSAFRQFCTVLETEFPHLLTQLLLDSTARLLLHRTDHKVVNFEENSDQLFIDEDILKAPNTTSPTVTAKSSGVVSFRSPSEPRSSTQQVSSPVQYRTQRARSSMPSPRTASGILLQRTDSSILKIRDDSFDESNNLFLLETVEQVPVPPLTPTKSPAKTERKWGLLSFRSPSEPRSSGKRIASPVQYRAQRARSQMPSTRAAYSLYNPTPGGLIVYPDSPRIHNQQFFIPTSQPGTPSRTSRSGCPTPLVGVKHTTCSQHGCGSPRYVGSPCGTPKLIGTPLLTYRGSSAHNPNLIHSRSSSDATPTPFFHSRSGSSLSSQASPGFLPKCSNSLMKQWLNC